MIEFDTLAMKAETNDMHAIFLLKKNVQADIIKTILGYPLMAAPNTLKEWKVVITSVEQGYESMESQHDYKTEMGMIFGGWGAPMDIGKSWDNFDKDGKSKCFNCNIYRHLAKECKRPKKDREMRKYYKCNKVGHLAKNCRTGQKMKIRRNQENLEKEDNNKKEGFVKGSE